MRFRCFAKINLSLEITGKRSDGFHDLVSLVHTVSLADELCIEPAETLLTHVEGLDIQEEDNLVARAAGLLATTLGGSRGARLSLVKRIPAAAGLGGGSSDAASALVGLNALWGARLSVATLCELGAALGSDVPFFVRGGAALMRGRGTELDDLPPRRGQWLVLLVPPGTIADKTRRLYAALEPTDFSNGEMTLHAADRLRNAEALDERALVNGFERAARRMFPGLEEMWQAAERLAHRRFSLSGAGPALFSLTASRAEAGDVAGRLARLEARLFVVRTVAHARARIAALGGHHRVRLSAT
ncbi:MAG: 4-(cytidine 5'-diphospho)-2-C-methyl-D-erythritol kinase [Chloroflexi bacterium]|nr:4-(cytidine 5'-diphospho)-2-C-methyl-D-erythritol kinase [Chloroflexota bacterium]